MYALKFICCKRRMSLTVKKILQINNPLWPLLRCVSVYINVCIFVYVCICNGCKLSKYIVKLFNAFVVVLNVYTIDVFGEDVIKTYNGSWLDPAKYI